MKIQKLKTKTRIILEWNHLSENYFTITKEDLKKLHFRVFPYKGEDLFVEDIKQITLKLKQEEDLI